MKIRSVFLGKGSFLIKSDADTKFEIDGRSLYKPSYKFSWGLIPEVAFVLALEKGALKVINLPLTPLKEYSTSGAI